MLRIISDVHGKHSQYLDIIKDCEASVQLGDFGFNYTALSAVDENKHKLIKGNHDNYDINVPHDLGDSGIAAVNGVEFFFCRGAFSVDWKNRVIFEVAGKGKSWWSEEELSFNDMNLALQRYKLAKPDIVITHSCPSYISKRVGKSDTLRYFGYDPNTFTTNTQELFQAMSNFHRPKIWVFGHYHRYYSETINRTRFICLPELGYIDITPNGEVIK